MSKYAPYPETARFITKKQAMAFVKKKNKRAIKYKWRVKRLTLARNKGNYKRIKYIAIKGKK